MFQFLGSFFAGLGRAGAPPEGTDVSAFFKLVASLKRDLPISVPILRELASLETGRTADNEEGILKKRINRCYLRLCRVQEELSRLDLKKAASGSTLEDYVFSRIDFSRYREIDIGYYEVLFSEGLRDFDETFLSKKFGIAREELQSLMEGCYKKTERYYKIQKENPLILSVMRTLETSLENSALFTAVEIREEIINLYDFAGGVSVKGKILPGMEKLYPLLVLGLDGVTIAHADGMTTKLFISRDGDLSGTFRPSDKPWTKVLVPAVLI